MRQSLGGAALGQVLEEPVADHAVAGDDERLASAHAPSPAPPPSGGVAVLLTACEMFLTSSPARHRGGKASLRTTETLAKTKAAQSFSRFDGHEPDAGDHHHGARPGAHQRHPPGPVDRSLGARGRGLLGDDGQEDRPTEPDLVDLRRAPRVQRLGAVDDRRDQPRQHRHHHVGARAVLADGGSRTWSARSLRLPYTFAVPKFGGRAWTSHQRRPAADPDAAAGRRGAERLAGRPEPRRCSSGCCWSAPPPPDSAAATSPRRCSTSRSSIRSGRRASPSASTPPAGTSAWPWPSCWCRWPSSSGCRRRR